MKILTEKTVYELIQKYPKIKDYLINRGFSAINNPVLLNTVAKSITLKSALENKGYDMAIIEHEIMQIINEYDENKNDLSNDALKLIGGLPCPISMPIKERLNLYQNHLEYELNPASMGDDWIEESTKTTIGDIYMTAGFDLFFRRKSLHEFFKDYKSVMSENDYLENMEEFIDKQGQFTIYGGVPAVLLVNKKLLGNRKLPTTWEELLSEEFENSIALPVTDLDLFDAIVLTLHSHFGEEAVKKLHRNFAQNLHPSKMVELSKGFKTADLPLFCVIPYFFSTMVKNQDNYEILWLDDGVVLSPIFITAKQNEKTKDFAKFMLCEDTVKVFNGNDLFFTTPKTLKTPLNSQRKYIWAGFDFLRNNDIDQILTKAHNEFEG